MTPSEARNAAFELAAKEARKQANVYRSNLQGAVSGSLGDEYRFGIVACERVESAIRALISSAPAPVEGTEIVPEEPGIGFWDALERALYKAWETDGPDEMTEVFAQWNKSRKDLKSLAPLPAPQAGNAPVVSVLEMKTTAGSDYFVQVKCGKRSMTPYMSKIKGRAEFSAAEFQWLLNGGEKPHLSDWLDRTKAPVQAGNAVEDEVVERVAQALYIDDRKDLGAMPWGKIIDYNPELASEFRSQARAALAAIHSAKE